MKYINVLILLISFAISVAQAEEPDLPEGLFEDSIDQIVVEEPSLSDGLKGTISEEPDLPIVLGSEALIEATAFDSDLDEPEPFELSGFWEIRLGMRVQNDPYEPNRSIAETRLQLDFEKNISAVNTHFVADIIYDDLEASQHIQLENGQGWLDLREANFSFTPTNFLDIKAGRQILTWGTGDLLFINDLFPKDWQAFFIGRDVAYLKAPSDAIKLAFFSDMVNFDLIYTPRFDADRFIDGGRISYFNPLSGAIVGQNAIAMVDRPSEIFADDEIAVRMYRNFSVIEAALYVYDGFWKSPTGFEPLLGLNTFPKLRVYGASVRMPVGKGIGNLELGYYDSPSDRQGNSPFINNSEFRFLLGYEQEMAKNLTLGLQYYLEQMLDYDAYRATLPVGFLARDHHRHLLTARMTRLSHQQNMIWSLFAYVSPSDNDFYLRTKVKYKIDDYWSYEVGANVFGGTDKHTFFAQFADNTNFYGAIRFGF